MGRPPEIESLQPSGRTEGIISSSGGGRRPLGMKGTGVDTPSDHHLKSENRNDGDAADSAR